MTYATIVAVAAVLLCSVAVYRNRAQLVRRWAKWRRKRDLRKRMKRERNCDQCGALVTDKFETCDGNGSHYDTHGTYVGKVVMAKAEVTIVAQGAQ